MSPCDFRREGDEQVCTTCARRWAQGEDLPVCSERARVVVTVDPATPGSFVYSGGGKRMATHARPVPNFDPQLFVKRLKGSAPYAPLTIERMERIAFEAFYAGVAAARAS